MSVQQIAQTIAEQMGGLGRLSVMIGAKDFCSTDSQGLGGLQFAFKMYSKANKVVIYLMPDDTYTVQFWKCSRSVVKMVSEHEMIYFDQLVGLFQKVTGLRLSL